MNACKNCPYRKLLAIIFDIHVDMVDCWEYGANFCEAAKGVKK